MAKTSPIKLKQEADAAERAGRFDKAIDALKQIVSDSPKDWNTINRIGDLYMRLQNPRAANEQYVKVARFFAEDGFNLKAIAVWKKVLRNDAAMLEGYKELGELYAKQGLVAEAKQTLGVVYEEHVKRGRLREAGEILRRTAEVDPSDMKVRIRLAELYGKEGHSEKAAAEYVALSDDLVKKSLLAEALQLLEKALRGGARSPLLLSAAARVHLVQKDYARAIALLEEARRSAPEDRDVALRLAEACLGSKRPDDARSVLESLLARDPSDVDARVQLGQVYLAEGRHDDAFEQLQPAVDRLAERRQAERAASLLQQVVQKNPQHIRSLAKLVELYRQSRNDMLVAQTYSQMVDAYVAAGGLEQAASIVEMLVQLEPHNEQHRTRLRWLREQHGGPAGFEVDLERAPAVPSSLLSPPKPAAPAGIELSGPLSPEDQEFVSEHLAEGRVFRKYGLGDKAKEQYEAILGRFPDNLEALSELSELLRERGDNEAAAQRLRVLAEVLRLKGDSTRAASVDRQVRDLAGEAAAPEPAAASLGDQAPAPSAAPSAATPAGLDVEIDVEETGPDATPPAGVEEAELEEFSLEPVPPAEPEAEPSAVAFDEHDFDHKDLETRFIDDDEAVPPAAPAVEPPAAAAEEAGFDLGPPEPPAPEPESPPLAEAGFDLEEAPPETLPPSLRTAELRVAQAPAPLAADAPLELRRALDEIRQYVALGFVDDAKTLLADAWARHPGHPALEAIVAELGLQLPSTGEAEELVFVDAPAHVVVVPPPASPTAEEPLQLGADFLEFTPLPAKPAAALPAPAPEPPAEDELPAPEAVAPEPAAPEGGFDLASELGDLFGAQPAVAAEPAAEAGTDFGDASLQDIFREFQKGVDKQLGKEDYETRYNLGIAYKEMGLVDEAIAEFQLAAKDESRLLECSSMLGICFLEKGMPKLAVKWFEKGLSAPGRSEEEYQGLRYDLASALEQAGEAERALALFSELYGQDASFRDVAEKVKELGAGR